MGTFATMMAKSKPLGSVPNSGELQRILALPRRTLDLENVDDVTPMFERPGGTLRFWPIQSAALIEAALADGLFAPVAVGAGKTLIGLALPRAMDSKCAVYLVKPSLKKQLQREMHEVYGKHFDLPLDVLHVVSYTELSSAKKANILEEISPDLIIADEAHCLARPQAARTKRFLRYMKEHPECRFAALSGTMTNRSITEFAHLIELALRKNSPVPRGYHELRDWGGAIDVKPEYVMRPGALKKLCREGESVRSGFRRRLVETPGVVATSEGALGTSLVIQKLSLRVPQKIKALMQRVRKTWRIGDEELSEATEMARVQKQLSCGFYYRWDWPDGEKDYEWLEARTNWNREVRQKLKYATDDMDSPFLLAQAAERYFKGKREGKVWNSEWWPLWRELKDRKPPPTVPEWQSDFLLLAAMAWARKQKEPAIIWYEWKAVGERLAELSGFPHYGAGADANDAVAAKHPVIIASIEAQGTGKNLQYHYCRNLLTSVPPNGTKFEQLAGRTHRPGQEHDEVTIDWFGHTDAAQGSFAQVIEDAEYQEEATGQRQKVLYAMKLYE